MRLLDPQRGDEVNFPPAPKGYYLQIKRSMEQHYPTPPWRVVLMRKIWGFIPVEVAAAGLTGLSDAEVKDAANLAILDFYARKASALQNEARKRANRQERKNKS